MLTAKHTNTISIAGFKIELVSDNIQSIDLHPTIAQFRCNNNQIPDVRIEIRNSTPENLQLPHETIFESGHNNNKIFSIHQLPGKLAFETYSDLEPNYLKQIALLDENLTHWTVYNLNNKEEVLSYPLGPLVYYYLCVKNHAILMHASGVQHKGKGMVFAGFSGAGKSTLAALHADKKAICINDDRLLVRKEASNFIMHNTPMLYPDAPKSTSLDSIYLIHHNNTNIAKKLSVSDAVSKLMSVCIQHSYRKEILCGHLDFISDLCNHVPVYDLGFRNNSSIIEYLESHE